MTDQLAQIIDQVNTARHSNRPLLIKGGGSKSFMGRASSEGDILEVSGHRGIVNYQPVELVLTARAGTPIRDIEAALDEQGQRLSFEPPLFGGEATIGGTLATNQSGPGRPWQGSVRDMVLGVRLVNGEGEHLRFGGQVMKNVAGYDLSRFQAGAMGTLGVITEVSLKVLPKPACSRTLRIECDAQEAIDTMNRLAGTPKPLTAACWLDGVLYLRLEGASSAVEGTIAQWPGAVWEEVADFWTRLREQQLDYFEGDQPLWRFSINSAAPQLAAAGQLIDWGGSQRWLRGEQDSEALQHWAREQGGSVALYRGGDRLGEVNPPLPEPIQRLHQRVKHAVDPHGLFNPGRLYSWL
ncbi:glycolate oxidase subunit GlcE [Aestuariirhabdus litorea]|uniref:Glycolate oxidase subunit GlcE n=1 Tax=Aestuariirhabdus litorea TaxID=2528527 RepID=A0A3P3VNE9_9GAMM|nr:glycolate oxidase subunit GlcE [Aestuariirhabdus litorea]RRJ84281.1 glycolate oxidase subunit GlcE [Aestuariirhabdus litorea]RWW97503.1 glycolate oxidase subunit GlcE [Endozoicomonadaceae bacterium GTF-13]